MATQIVRQPVHSGPPLMFKPLTERTVSKVVSVLTAAAQDIDATAEERFTLEQFPGYLKARINFIARAAIRSCFDAVLRDGELKARAAMAETLYARPFDRLSPREQARVFECTKAALTAYQRHLEGISGELLPSERDSLRLPGELS